MTWHEQIIISASNLVDKPLITVFMALVAYIFLSALKHENGR